MSAHGSITFDWADGERRFRLAIKQLRELENARNTGVLELARRIEQSQWRVDDIVEVLRLGLIGGGMHPTEALGLVSRQVAPGNILPNVFAAHNVLLAALIGDPVDRLGKLTADIEAATAAASSMGASDGRQSSETPLQWDGPSPPSTSAQYGNTPQPSKDGSGATVLPTTNGRDQ